MLKTSKLCRENLFSSPFDAILTLHSSQIHMLAFKVDCEHRVLKTSDQCYPFGITLHVCLSITGTKEGSWRVCCFPKPCGWKTRGEVALFYIHYKYVDQRSLVLLILSPPGLKLIIDFSHLGLKESKSKFDFVGDWDQPQVVMVHRPS